VTVPLEARDKPANTAWWYFVRGLGVANTGTLPDLAGFLQQNAGPDHVVVCTGTASRAWDIHSLQRASGRAAGSGPMRSCFA
jgi:hypothetical protein